MVEIKINTDTASKEDIKRAVEFLKRYIEYETTSEYPDAPTSAMNIFGDNSPSLAAPPEEPTEESEEEPDIEIKPIFY